jgi:hypothetical protein
LASYPNGYLNVAEVKPSMFDFHDCFVIEFWYKEKMDRRKDEREQPDHKEAHPGTKGRSQCGQHLSAVTRSLLYTSQEQRPPAHYWQAGKQGFL